MHWIQQIFEAAPFNEDFTSRKNLSAVPILPVVRLPLSRQIGPKPVASAPGDLSSRLTWAV